MYWSTNWISKDDNDMKIEVDKGPTPQHPNTHKNGTSRLKRDPKGALAKKVWLATKNWIGDEKRHPILYNWRVSRGPSRLASILANGP